MQIIGRVLCGLALALFGFSAHAGGTITGKVQVLYTMYVGNAEDRASNIALVKIAGQVTGSPPCSPGGEWAFSLKDPSGRAMYAQLLHAQAAGLNVRIVGDGTCTTWGDRERPLYMYVVYQ